MPIRTSRTSDKDRDFSVRHAAVLRDREDTDAEVQAAREVLASLLVAMKNHGLYPSTHVICQKSILSMHTRLANFLEEYESLRLDVEKDRLLVKGQVVHHDGTGSDKLALMLFRDGIEWLEFEKGVEQKEILVFLQILHKYRDLQDEAEGDLVTALWEAQFQNVQYKTSDIYWDSEPLLDLSLLSAGGPQNTRTEGDETESENTARDAFQDMDPGLWKLTPEELGSLNAMVRDEEERDSSQDMLDVIRALLNDQGNEKDLSIVLEFLEGEFQDAIHRVTSGFPISWLSTFMGWSRLALQANRGHFRYWPVSSRDCQVRRYWVASPGFGQPWIVWIQTS